MDQLVGTLSSLSIYNDKWGRAKVKLDDGSQIACVGEALVGLMEGNRYKFDGRLVTHERYGRQIAVAAAAIDLPCSEEALVRHLRANFKGCGEVTAKKLVAKYRDRLPELRDILINDPHALDFSSVTRRAIRAKEDFDLVSLIYRDLSMRLASIGLRDAVVRRLAEWLLAQLPAGADPAAGDPAASDPIPSAWALFCANPYAPIQQVEGYVFAAADKAALALVGRPRRDPHRMAALATHVVCELSEHLGHTFVSPEQVAARMVAYDSTIEADEALTVALEDQQPIVEEDGHFYPRALYFCESVLAATLARRALSLAQPMYDGAPENLQTEIDAAEHVLGTGFRLDPSQREAVSAILSSSHLLHTVTAGPGSGKTALMEILSYVLQDKQIVFCAPTGKAAKVLAERVRRFGFWASTIHALLGVNDNGFTFNADNPLDADVVVADEASMNDLALTRALVDALLPDCHLVLLGDTGQLPSVGAGQVLSDLLELPGNHRHLTETHRHNGGILEVVQQCGQGRIDCRDRPQVSFSHRLPFPNEAGIASVMERYLAAIDKYGIANVGLLMPRRKGELHTPAWNTTYLNERIRRRLNPDGGHIPGSALKIGDRIIVRKNLTLEQGTLPNGGPHFEQVVNGDTGFIRACETDSSGNSVQFLTLELDDGRNIRFPGKALESLGLAYAMTVHAAQGSEYQHVIFICTHGSASFVHRGLLYTAFSRAREQLTILGDDAVIKALCARPAPQRQSTLVERTRAVVRKMQGRGRR